MQISTLFAGCGHDSIIGLDHLRPLRAVDRPHRVQRFPCIGWLVKSRGLSSAIRTVFNSVHGVCLGVDRLHPPTRDLIYLGAPDDGVPASIGIWPFAHSIRARHMTYIVETHGVDGLPRAVSARRPLAPDIQEGVRTPTRHRLWRSRALGASFLSRELIPVRQDPAWCR